MASPFLAFAGGFANGAANSIAQNNLQTNDFRRLLFQALAQRQDQQGQDAAAMARLQAQIGATQGNIQTEEGFDASQAQAARDAAVAAAKNQSLDAEMANLGGLPYSQAAARLRGKGATDADILQRLGPAPGSQGGGAAPSAASSTIPGSFVDSPSQGSSGVSSDLSDLAATPTSSLLFGPLMRSGASTAPAPSTGATTPGSGNIPIPLTAEQQAQIAAAQAAQDTANRQNKIKDLTDVETTAGLLPQDMTQKRYVASIDQATGLDIPVPGQNRNGQIVGFYNPDVKTSADIAHLKASDADAASRTKIYGQEVANTGAYETGELQNDAQKNSDYMARTATMDPAVKERLISLRSQLVDLQKTVQQADAEKNKYVAMKPGTQKGQVDPKSRQDIINAQNQRILDAQAQMKTIQGQIDQIETPAPAPTGGGGGNMDLFKPLIRASASKYGVNPNAIKTILMMEDPSLNPGAINRANRDKSVDYGLMQVNSKTQDPNTYNWRDPATNINRGTQEFLSKLKAAKGNLWLAFRMYNGSGPKAVTYANKAMSLYNQFSAAPDTTTASAATVSGPVQIGGQSYDRNALVAEARKRGLIK